MASGNVNFKTAAFASLSGEQRGEVSARVHKLESAALSEGESYYGMKTTGEQIICRRNKLAGRYDFVIAGRRASRQAVAELLIRDLGQH